MEPGSAYEVSYGAWVGSGGGDPGPVDPGPVGSGPVGSGGGDPGPVDPGPDSVSFEFDGSF